MKKTFLAAVFLLMSASTLAFTECPAEIKKIYAGDDGIISIGYMNGGYFNIAADDPNLKNALALATTALANGNQVIVRFKTDNVDCTKGVLSGFQGLFLLKK